MSLWRRTPQQNASLDTEIIHNTKKPKKTKPNETKLALVQVHLLRHPPGNELGLFYNNSARDSHGPYTMYTLHTAKLMTMNTINEKWR